jgi:DNA-binding beta-propeller fold protein YncE
MAMLSPTALLLLVGVTGLEGGASPASAPAPDSKTHSVRSLPLPGAPAGGVLMDYIAYDRAHHRLWVPAGNTGSVDVVDVKTDHITRVEGFATSEVERQGTKRLVGPSSATVGEGVVYVGNRGDSSVCAVDAESLRIGACLKLASMPDGLAYVASTKEVWVTTPRDNSISIVDVAAAGVLTLKARIELPGQPEGFTVDDARGVFYTNLEDKDRTLTIDLKRRQVTRTWLPGCGEEGPRGLTLDRKLDFLMVACTDHVVVLDAGHEGKQLSTIEVGQGVDDLDYVEPRHELYGAAGRAAQLTIARLEAKGGLTRAATVPTAPGARNAVATDDGTAYVTDALEGKILVVAPVGSH